ncbi:hypothetical protein L3X38_012171 [Prunus dulcis]|uniref:Protein ALP1-like n=1 Tax=Prunus dulcis TaxID=3755 RepID=A0AAD4WJ36_PRUDU|nr:hypothetical protein L3X38_012171 [Prunus dulcis]
MIGSIDCMHWQWKNCPTAWQGDYGNRKGQKSIILEAVAGFDTWVWHAFFGVAGSQNDLNVLGQSPVFNDVLRGEAPNITYEINNTIYQTGYYLADGIYPRWTTFVKTIPHPRCHKQKFFARYQEGYRKDVERCFEKLAAVGWKEKFQSERPEAATCQRAVGGTVALIRIPGSQGPGVPETREANVKCTDKTEGKLDVCGHRHIRRQHIPKANCFCNWVPTVV